MLGLQNEREWAAFCDKVLQQPALATDERFSANFKRSANREVLRQIIVDSFAQLDTELVERINTKQHGIHKCPMFVKGNQSANR